ncbi:glycosyltransferase family 2 protein [Photobacterium kishitanii]|uniref:glycosyltransferase family 2 protein n=1 Tax=Photobacterium kishitanii TaxID=318456 RepID=UPI0004367CEF|nr:glycosyltransferase family 2 protein [Photobacterium kishitanii]OBU29017.1 glycosyl transferase [Photobacterium kishitanii]PSU92091.1 glycosyltransferase family 2 protein [Photobacterium kishitanii]PSV25636.1 glycosyltransferase family 2 protein [Photobacterium kishitanii]PSW69334.1 glycosyltransferase family 2 protein [Photobacterium kishitanii]CEO39488.1 Glycosyltransferase [Photobacterium kishitanii]
MILFLFIMTSLSIFAVIYHHALYPMLLSWFAKRHPQKPISPTPRKFSKNNQDCTLPTITIIIPAYNESQWIAEKIRNISYLDYPTDKLKVIIACDGCADNTVEIANNTIQEALCSDTHIEVLSLEKNQGKVAILNQFIPQYDSDIIALSDVSALISYDALLIAAKHFEKSYVGVVNATYRLLTPSSVGERKYWDYQTKIKQQEATFGDSLGAHGAFYLFRTSLFVPLDKETINDDFILPMSIVEQGYHAIYDPSICAVELDYVDKKDDFSRRLRISAGNIQQLIRLFSLFNPKYRGTAFTFFSGKGLRITMPYFMIMSYIGSGLLITYPLFLIAFICQTLGYSFGILGIILPRIFSHKSFQILAYLIAGHAANFIGGINYIFRRLIGPLNRVHK